ncbi:MAG: hypothetical protein E7520_04890 [Ruminococcaceae bacterium]|nr:hypothetical protein [Oscillospiraceae bacterium]
MYSIAYVIPYFGKFPKYMKLWLMSTGCNPTVDFLIFTDDKTEYDYPENVKVTYMSFDEMKSKAQSVFDFDICLEKPYKICDFRPAYGQIFKSELEGYDFWGHCDIDLIWGNIRKFYTDEILNQYERIGFNGHSTLYRNTPEVNARYRHISEKFENYIEVFSTDRGYAFDEPYMQSIYEERGIPVYMGIDFANLAKYDYSFNLSWQTEEEKYKNEHQIFTWQNGTLLRRYVHKGKLFSEEMMYLHYWCRPTTLKMKHYDKSRMLTIYPDVTTDKPYDITADFVLKKSRQNKIVYYAKSIWKNRKKITLERIIFNIKGMTKYKTTDYNTYKPKQP